MDTPGKEGTLFYMIIDNDFDNAEVLNTKDIELQILSKPVEIYHQWYWKILNKLTFGRFFNEGFIYDVKIIEDDKT